MAVPDTNLDIEGAVGQGLDAPPIPVAPDPVTNQPVQPAAGPNFNFTAQPAQYLQTIQPPKSEDFYVTPEAARGQGAEGPIITPRAPYVPLGVLANRQAELDRRTAQLQQDRAKFDPYSGVGDASPRYQPAFQKYATGEVDRYRNDIAESMFGGNQQMADDYLRTDPQGKAAFQRFTGGIEAVGTANKDLVTRVMNTMSDVMEDKKQLSPEEQKVYMDYLNVQDANGVPLKDANSQDFLVKQRAAEALVSQNEWNDKMLRPSAQNALQTITQSRPLEKDKKSGKWVLTTEETTQWDAFKDGAAKYGVEHNIFPNEKAAKDFLDAHYPTSTKETEKYMDPVKPAKAAKAGASDGKISVATGLAPATSYHTPGSEPYSGYKWDAAGSVPTISLSEGTGGKFKQLAPRVFDEIKNGKASQVTIESPQLKFIGGDWYVVGRDAGDGTTISSDLTKYDDAGYQVGPTTSKNTAKQSREVRIPLKEALPYLHTYLGNDFSVEKIVAQKAAENGIDWDQSKFEGWTKEQRQKAITKLFQ